MASPVSNTQQGIILQMVTTSRIYSTEEHAQYMDDLLTTNNIDPGHPEIMPVKAIWRNANTTPMVLLSRPCWEWHMLCATKDDGFHAAYPGEDPDRAHGRSK